MNDFTPPPARQLDPERRAQLKRHLLSEIARGEPRPRVSARGSWIALAAVVAGAAVATSALAWAGGLLDFVAGEPAPPPVRRTFELADEARERVLPIFRSGGGPEVIAERAHGVLAIDTSVGPVILWAAPARSGGACYILDIKASRLPDGRPNGGAGCSPRPLPDGRQGRGRLPPDSSPRSVPPAHRRTRDARRLRGRPPLRGRTGGSAAARRRLLPP